MLNRKLATLIATGFFLTAGAAQAASVFPSSVGEGPGDYAALPVMTNAVHNVSYPTAAPEGAVLAAVSHIEQRQATTSNDRIFPSSAPEGAQWQAALTAQAVIVADNGSIFPSSVEG